MLHRIADNLEMGSCCFPFCVEEEEEEKVVVNKTEAKNTPKVRSWRCR